MKKISDRKIIWAVDPFSDEPALQSSAVAAIERFVGKEDVEVHPVFVWEDSFYGVFKKKELKTLREDGQKSVDQLVAGKKLAITPLEVLGGDYPSIKAKAEALVQFSKELGAELIVLSTHSKRIPETWILGSFAETLSLVSDVPLLVTHLRWKPTAPSQKNVLFATDFSELSIAAFHHLVDLAKKASWTITIFHRVRAPTYPTYELAFAVWNNYEAVIEDEVRAKRAQANHLVKVAKRKGVRASIVIDKTQADDVASRILAALRKPYLMVAVAAQSGTLARTFLGSATRRLIRESPIPVWVIRPDRKEVDQKSKARLKARSKLRGKAPSLRDESDRRVIF